MGVEVHIENIFPTPIYVSSIDVSGVDVENVEFSPGDSLNENMLFVSNNERLLTEDKFKYLKDQIDQHTSHFYHNILGYSKNSYPTHASSWMVKSSPGQGSEPHIHTNSIISGVLYIKTSENCGNLEFRQENYLQLLSPFLPDVDVQTVYNNKSYVFTPQTGMLLIFQSSLRHKVHTNFSNESRYSIAFNYFLAGDFTSRTGMLSI